MLSVVEEWQPYLDARRSGEKKRWKPLLEERVAALNERSELERDRCIESLLHAYFGEGETDLPIQHPPIWQHALRQLSIGVRSERPNYLLWAFKAKQFQGVWDLLPEDAKKKPESLLKQIVEIDPSIKEARELLFLHYLDTLDYAQHELPSRLLVDAEICSGLVEECDAMLREFPELEKMKTRFGRKFGDYQRVHNGWLEYQALAPEVSFYDWLSKQ
jgi:hypothetical protein